MRVVPQSTELVHFTAFPQEAIESAARTCYKSEDRIKEGSSAEVLITKLIEKGHTAMLEFADATFRVVTDRGVSHELVRHRLASYAQESTRYCNYTQGKFDHQCTFVQPVDMTPEQIGIWTNAMLDAEGSYEIMVGHGCSAQIARSVLPNSLKTEIVMKMNFRQWRHFFKLRAASAAHPQMRPLAKEILTKLMSIAPAVFSDLNYLLDEPE